MTPQEFKQTVFPMRHKLYRLAKLLLRSQEEVEDTLQEVFLKLWTIRDRLVAYDSVEALGMRITRNHCLSKLKSLNRRRMVDVEDFDVESDQETPYQETEFSDSLRVMETLIEGLPHQQRVVMHLRHVEQCSFEEIEEITGLSASHIRVVLCRTRKRLSENYAKVNRYESQ